MRCFFFEIKKWVSENSPNKTSTPIRIENKNQFAPQGQDPRELKNHQKQVKLYILFCKQAHLEMRNALIDRLFNSQIESKYISKLLIPNSSNSLLKIKQDRLVDKKTPGYQSKILENINNIDEQDGGSYFKSIFKFSMMNFFFNSFSFFTSSTFAFLTLLIENLKKTRFVNTWIFLSIFKTKLHSTTQKWNAEILK